MEAWYLGTHTHQLFIYCKVIAGAKQRLGKPLSQGAYDAAYAWGPGREQITIHGCPVLDKIATLLSACGLGGGYLFVPLSGIKRGHLTCVFYFPGAVSLTGWSDPTRIRSVLIDPLLGCRGLLRGPGLCTANCHAANMGSLDSPLHPDEGSAGMLVQYSCLSCSVFCPYSSSDELGHPKGPRHNGEAFFHSHCQALEGPPGHRVRGPGPWPLPRQERALRRAPCGPRADARAAREPAFWTKADSHRHYPAPHILSPCCVCVRLRKDTPMPVSRLNFFNPALFFSKEQEAEP